MSSNDEVEFARAAHTTVEQRLGMTAVANPRREPPTRDSETVPAVLRFVAELLARPVPGAPAEVLTELARHFAARGAGLTGAVSAAAWPNGAPSPLPWKQQPALQEGLANRREAAVLHDAGGSWLLWLAPGADSSTPSGLWLCGDPARAWTETDAAALAVAGQALLRADPPAASDHAEERLALAAHVASRLSHDFGNLLTGVLGFTELTLSKVTPGTPAQRYLQEVWDVARTGADWLKRLNLFCRRTAPEFTPTGLPGALAEEEARLDAAQPARWQTEIPPELPAIACDADSLRQALRQVLDNAREAVGAEGVLTLTARAVEVSAAESQLLLGQPPAGSYVLVTVTDRGPGLSDEVRARLFRDFFYSSKPRHRGMGLLITYGILRRFGGGLALKAAPEGGTQVELYFPAAPEPAPAGPANLLVVDEDPQVLADARRILEPAGYRVSVATAPLEALALYQATTPPFDLVLLAVQWVGLTGPEVARRMQLRDPDATFLFLHTPGTASLPHSELLSPATLVHKPLAPAALLQAVAAALRRRREAE